MQKVIYATAILLLLAACNGTRTGSEPTTGAVYNPNGTVYNPNTGTTYNPQTGEAYNPNAGSGSSLLSNEPPNYGANTPQDRAAQGCASGQSADLLHQNRPGGSDYSAMRCGTQGY